MVRRKRKRMIEREVTPEHIANGIRGCDGKCPIALSLGDIDYRAVDWDQISVQPDCIIVAEDLEIYMDNHMQNFVADFDNGRPAEPFKFEINGQVASTIL